MQPNVRYQDWSAQVEEVLKKDIKGDESQQVTMGSILPNIPEQNPR